MAKCTICNSRKGKRKCLNEDGQVCNQCCGTTRTEETCSGCTYYQKPKRKYNDIPAYSVSEMNGSMELQSYGNTIESTLCAYDTACGGKLKDSQAIRIIELLIDKYHFQDQQMDQEDEIITNGVKLVDKSISDDLHDVEKEKIVKILRIIWFVARRRTRIGREYIDFIHEYVGKRVAPGIRALKLEDYPASNDKVDLKTLNNGTWKR